MIIINHFYYLYLPCKKAGKSRRYCKKEYSKNLQAWSACRFSFSGRGRWSRTTDNGVKVRCLTAWRYPHIKESAGQGPSFPVFR